MNLEQLANTSDKYINVVPRMGYAAGIEWLDIVDDFIEVKEKSNLKASGVLGAVAGYLCMVVASQLVPYDHDIMPTILAITSPLTYIIRKSYEPKIKEQ